MTDQISLLETLSEGQTYSSAIFGTYQFDGEFFESEILPTLEQLDIANIVVLTDTQSYTEAENLTKAGQSYYLEHVRCPEIHHPKFTMLLGHGDGRLFLGSANLTEEGWQRSGELMTIVDYPQTDAGDDAIPLFGSLRDFIKEEQSRIHGSRAISAIDEAFRDAPWLPETTPNDGEHSTQLLHNHTEPIFPQLLNQLESRSIEEITVCSPFFSGTNPAVFEQLCELNPDSINVNIQPDRVKGFDPEIVEADCFQDIDLSVNEYSLTDDDEDRYLHAKLLIFKGSDGVWAFFGSANFTIPAMLKDSTAGNVEAGLLRYEPNREYFSYLLDPETVSTASINPESVTHRPPTTTDSSTTQSDFYLTDAYLETDGTVVIEYDQPDPETVTVTLRRSPGDETISKENIHPEDGAIRIKDPDIEQFCNQAVEVSLTATYEDRTEQSSKRWLSLPTLEQTPRPSEIKTVETTAGREGLLEVIDRLPTWGYICDFLDTIDIDGTGGRNLGRNVTPGGGSFGGSGEEKWNPKSRDELISSKLEYQLDKFEETTNDLMMTPKDSELFKTFVNQTVAVSKLILWFDTQDEYTLKYVQHIRSVMKDIIELLDVINRYSDPEVPRNLEADHSLFEHAAIIISYVDHLQRQAGYDRGANENLYQVFQDTNRNIVYRFRELREGNGLDEEQLKDCLEEYELIQTTSPTPKEITEYCQNLIDE